MNFFKSSIGLANFTLSTSLLCALAICALVTVPGFAEDEVESPKVTVDVSFGDKGVLTGLVEPKAIDIDADGNIYILDKGRDGVFKYDDKGGSEEQLVTVRGKSNNVRTVEVDDEGGLWYTDGSHTIQGPGVKIGGYELNEDKKSTPRSTVWSCGFTLGADNKIYVRTVSGRGFKVYDRTVDGLDGFLYDLESKEAFHNAPEGPGLTTDGKGNFWGTGHTHQVRKVIDDGESLSSSYTFGKRGSAPGQFEHPMGIFYAEDGGLYVADSGNNRIQKLVEDGDSLKVEWVFTGEGQATFTTPVDVHVQGGNLYILTTGEDPKLIRYKLFDQGISPS